MKVILFVVFFTAVFGQLNCAPRDDEDLADKIKDIINKFIDNVPDPIAITDVDIEIPTNDIINGNLNISEISLSGLKNLNIDTLTFDQETNRLDYSINFEDIITVIESDLTLHDLIELEHALSIKVDLKNLKTEGYAVLAEDQKSVEDFSILTTLGESDFDIKGLLNNDELSEEVSKALTENVAKVLDAVNEAISPVVSEVVKVLINVILKIKG